MSVIDEPEVEPVRDRSDGSDGPAPETRRPHRRVSVPPVLLVVLVLLVPALWLGYVGVSRATEPDVLERYDRPGSGSFGPAEVGERLTIGLLHPPLPAITIRSARVITTKGSAAAATAVSVCRSVQPDDPKGVGVGFWQGDVSEFCSELVPVDGVDLATLAPGDSIVTTVVPLGTGHVGLEAVEISYERGGRTATDRIELGDAVKPVT